MSSHLPRLSWLLRSLSNPLCPIHPSRIWKLGKTQLFQTDADYSIFIPCMVTKLQNKLQTLNTCPSFPGSVSGWLGLPGPTNIPSLFTSHLSQTLLFRHSFLLPITISTDLINVSNNTLIFKPKSLIPTWLFMSVCMDLCIHSVTCQYIFSCNFRDIRIPCFSIPISNIPFTVLC